MFTSVSQTVKLHNSKRRRGRRGTETVCLVLGVPDGALILKTMQCLLGMLTHTHTTTHLFLGSSPREMRANANANAKKKKKKTNKTSLELETPACSCSCSRSCTRMTCRLRGSQARKRCSNHSKPTTTSEVYVDGPQKSPERKEASYRTIRAARKHKLRSSTRKRNRYIYLGGKIYMNANAWISRTL